MKKKQDICDCLREEEDLKYCIKLGRKTELDDFDMENKCKTDLYELCSFHPKYKKNRVFRVIK